MLYTDTRPRRNEVGIAIPTSYGHHLQGTNEELCDEHRSQASAVKWLGVTELWHTRGTKSLGGNHPSSELPGSTIIESKLGRRVIVVYLGFHVAHGTYTRVHFASGSRYIAGHYRSVSC